MWYVPEYGAVLVAGGHDDGEHVPFFEDVEDDVDDGGDQVPTDEDGSEAAVDDHYYRWWTTPAGTSKSPEDCTSRLSCYKTKETIQKVVVPSLLSLSSSSIRVL